VFSGCQEVTVSLPQRRGQSTRAQRRPGWELPSSCFPTVRLLPPPLQAETRGPQQSNPSLQDRAGESQGRSRCSSEAFPRRAGEHVGTRCGGDIALPDGFEDWGAEGEEKRPVKCVYVWEEQRRAEERPGVPAPEMCQRSLVPPGPEHQPGTTSGGGSRVCAEPCFEQGEER